ncbi:MAG: cytochrome c peroxidase [Lentimonas sp.]
MPRLPRYLYLYLLVFHSHGYLSAATSGELKLSHEGTRILLDAELNISGYTHGRMESSTDMNEWSRIGALALIDGRGAIELVETLESPFSDSMFFRLITDNSASNVLELATIPASYSGIVWPNHLATAEVIASDNTPAANSVTDAAALLGRVLFYDKKLSANYSLSCAACHQQAHGFSDPAALSTGFDGGLTGRNSMGLTNSQFYERGSFFWDERAATLEEQVLEPIQNEVEMGLSLAELVSRVSAYEYYPQLFSDAFGDSSVSSERIALALAQFVRSIVSTQSKYDLGEASEFSNFTQQELQGMDLFNGPRGRCNACHEGPNFVGSRIDNNGLEFPYIDRGVGAVTGREGAEGKFKMSSLRNIEMTAPYMHDGRFATLEEVIEHYGSEVVDNPNLGGALTHSDGSVRRPNFTASEQADLVAFLLTLTDHSLLDDPKFADPFAAGVQ